MQNNSAAYTYQKLCEDMRILKNVFPELEVGSIGESYLKRDLLYLRLGSGKKKIMFNGVHHGMEWITSVLLMKFSGDFLRTMAEGGKIGGYIPKQLSERVSLYIVPMVNPDGVEISATGKLPAEMSDEERKFLTECNGSADFSRWQANARGVDLNHNYDALWESSKAMEAENGILGPGPTRFSGTEAFSEPESQAMAKFTRSNEFELTISFHSQGQVIYHGFGQKMPPMSEQIAKAFEKVSPYKIEEIRGIASVGGYKDWFVNEFFRPGFTVEVGCGVNPLPVESFPIIYKETLPIFLGAMTI